MSYQVLARKWRPNRFDELVGQEHVVTAISNALDNNRLHHAYLFTGTRGVGKTTIARIFSKSLNCEQGQSAKPCGQCSTCREIENGNFIDLLEIDAASRTKVEDTRELLDNVQYKPSRGRFKVYLIDEVHMLSKHSFNALLKTLEEPPPHVKFLLATTDPQKLPVTILSRCLQFNLKALSRSQISQQLEFVLNQEKIEQEPEALGQLARAAQGSMRDALSLTDQAIAQGNGQVTLKIVTDMLGLMDKNQVLKLVNALVQKDSASVMQQVETMSAQAPDYGLILTEMMSLLHQIALTQFVPEACKLETIAARAIYQLAKTVPAEQIQLLYQISLTGKKDLPHAADPRTGLEMTLLRMLAFCPGDLKLDAIDIAAQTPDGNQTLPTPSLVSQDTAQQQQQQQQQQQHPEQTVSASETSSNSTTEAEQALFAQQQEILTQAQDFGHQTSEEARYQEAQLAEMDAQFSEYVEPASEQPNTPEVIDDYQVPLESAEPSQTPAPSVPQSPSQSTADLIALRNQLKQNQREQQEGKEQEKKSESKPSLNLASIRSNNTDANQSATSQDAAQPTDVGETLGAEPTKLHDNSPQPQETESLSQDTQVKPEDIAPQSEVNSPEFTAEPANEGGQSANASPPWDTNAQTAATGEPVEASLQEKSSIEAQPFDPNAHLDEENVGEVTLEIPAFLANKQKVSKALQVDDWSRLIEDMQLTALTKQLALHSAFEQQGNTVALTLLEGKAHLMSVTAQQQLSEALNIALNTQVQLEIELGQPINTPYALQLKVNQVRHEYAQQVVKTDPGIQLLQQQFSAQVNAQSIQAR